METVELPSPLEGMKGAFVESLKRKNSKIREDRALSIAETTQLLYRRKVEDMEMEMSTLKRDRMNMLDLSPTDAKSLVLASDFDANVFIAKDIEIGLKIRNLRIALDIAKEQYNYLFGE